MQPEIMMETMMNNSVRFTSSKGHRFLCWSGGCAWLAVACILQTGIYFVANHASKNRGVNDQPSSTPKRSFVLIEKIESPKDVAHEPLKKTISESERKPTPKIVQKQRLKKKTAPKSQNTEKNNASIKNPSTEKEPVQAPLEFRDLGRMGSVDESVVGTGSGSFTVSVGNSDVSGAIGTGGRMDKKISMSNVKQPEIEKPNSSKPGLKVVSISDLSERAAPNEAYNRKLKARYPEALRRESVDGEVLALLVVLADGRVGSVKVLRSSHDAFSASAKEVLTNFRFSPAKDKNGSAVTSRIRITYRFALES